MNQLLKEYTNKVIVEHLIETVFLVVENKVKIKIPQNPDQKSKLITLAMKLGDLMKAPQEYVADAVQASKKGDWSPVLELVRDYFVMKKIPFEMEK